MLLFVSSSPQLLLQNSIPSVYYLNSCCVRHNTLDNECDHLLLLWCFCHLVLECSCVAIFVWPYRMFAWISVFPSFDIVYPRCLNLLVRLIFILPSNPTDVHRYSTFLKFMSNPASRYESLSFFTMKLRSRDHNLVVCKTYGVKNVIAN